ncbi:MAG: nuclear transport factor 2 family protein [Parvularculaceae bacterium]
MTKTILMLTIAGAAFAGAAHAADYKASCSRGADARVIEVIAPGTVGQSCDVRYTRGGGNVSVPYHADSSAAFCDGKAREMAQRLVSAGFTCNGAAPALRADAAPQSDYVVEAKRAEPAPAAAPSPAPAAAAPNPAPAAPVAQQQSAAPQASADAVVVAAAAEAAAEDDNVDAMMDEILAQPPAAQAAAGAPAQLVANQAAVEPAAPPPASAGRLVGAAPELKAAAPVTPASVTIEAPKAETPKAAAVEAPKTEAPKAAAAPAETKVAQAEAQKAEAQKAEAPKVAAPQPAKPVAPSAATRGPREIIIATLMAQAAAWNEGDLDGFMNGYVKDENLRFVSGGTVIKGWNAVMKRYRDTYQNGTSFGQLGFDKLDVRLVTDDVAVVTGQFNLAQNGALTTGMFSLVMRRMDGVWRIVHDHTTSGAQ